MRATEDRLQVAEIVTAAQAGDADAWSELVSRFQDAAVGLAVANGHWADAEDVAQEAFVLALLNLKSLSDPQAFPSWFVTLVRTASLRRHRSARPALPLEKADLAPREYRDGLELLERQESAEAVRAAVESLPPHERAVIALHYLGDLSHRRLAQFLGISESAAKKRAWSARTRLKELLPMVTDGLAAARPSRNQRFRDTVLLFAAIRDGDERAVRDLVVGDPGLVHATEDWTFDEGVASRLGPAAKATPLVRAVGMGHLGVVRALVEAGAPVNDLCQCKGGESPLWTAVAFGETEIVDYLLDQGADPNARAFSGATPLHAAVQTGHHHLVERLLEGGASAGAVDGHGRRASDWAALSVSRRPGPKEGEFLETGIRVLDLFAPLRRGALVQVPPAYGLGQVVVLFQVAEHLGPVDFWHLGFEYGLQGNWQVEHGSRESGIAVTAGLVSMDQDATSRRRAFAEAISAALRDDRPKIVVCQQVSGHVHDVMLALPRLAECRSVLATFVTEPFTGTYPPIPEEMPEGFDARFAFARTRASAGLWPAIDPLRTESRRWPNERHASVSRAARSLFARYETLDPALAMPDPLTLPDPAVARVAQALIRYLAQPLRVAELATSLPGERTSHEELLDTVMSLLDL